jgi:hypothetical protein
LPQQDKEDFMPTYIWENKILPLREAAMYPVMAFGEELTKTAEAIRIFKDDDEFRKWAEKTVHADKIRAALRDLEEKVYPEQKNEAWIEQVQTSGLNLAQQNFNAFAKLLEKPPRDEEVIRKAMIDRTPLIPKLFDPIILYDREIEHVPPTGGPVNPNTCMLIVPNGFWPNLNWVGWNDRPRSIRIFGVVALCENYWFNLFGGRWCWVAGFNGLLNLRHMAFDKITSSIMAF